MCHTALRYFPKIRLKVAKIIPKDLLNGGIASEDIVRVAFPLLDPDVVLLTAFTKGSGLDILLLASRDASSNESAR